MLYDQLAAIGQTLALRCGLSRKSSTSSSRPGGGEPSRPAVCGKSNLDAGPRALGVERLNAAGAANEPALGGGRGSGAEDDAGPRERLLGLPRRAQTDRENEVVGSCPIRRYGMIEFGSRAARRAAVAEPAENVVGL